MGLVQGQHIASDDRVAQGRGRELLHMELVFADNRSFIGW